MIRESFAKQADPMTAPALKNLAAELKRRGWTQRLLAEQTGRTQAHICLILQGKRESAVLLAKLKELSETDAPKPVVVP